MSSALPEAVDAWRMVSARRIFEGRIRLDSMPRLAMYLADAEGECEYLLEFDRDASGVAFLQVRAEARLPLVCQRTLERFELPVSIHQRLGLIRSEAEEAGLPEGVEPMLVPQDGTLRPADAIEDELILAVPVVPLSQSGATEDGVVWQDVDGPQVPSQDSVQASPFAALADWKKHAG